MIVEAFDFAFETTMGAALELGPSKVFAGVIDIEDGVQAAVLSG